MRQGRLQKIVQVVLCMTMLFYCMGAGSVMAAEEISRLVLSKNELTMEIGDTQSLTATAVYVNGKTEEVTIKTDWESENPEVASVYAGTITAKGEGTAVLTATYQGKTVVVKVTIHKKVKALTKDRHSLQLRTGVKEQVELTAFYSDGTKEVVTEKAEWSVDNYEVATVVNGTVEGLGSGTATVVAKFGSRSVSIPVSVELVRRLDADKPQVSLLVDGTERITLQATFPDGTVEDVTEQAEWSSSNETVADAIRGEITAYAPGETVITAKYGSKSASVKVDVDSAKKLEVDRQSLFMRVNNTEQLTLKATYADGRVEDITNAAKWTSSDEKIAFVSKGKVHASAPGEVIITAHFEAKSIDIAIDVEVPRLLEIDREFLSLQKGQSEPLKLFATYQDGTREDVTNKAEWKSDKEATAFAAKGVVTGKRSGEATITAKYGNKTASIVVDVDIPRKLTTDIDSLALQKGDTHQVTVHAVYADGRMEEVTHQAEWSAGSDSSVEVRRGLITATDSGEAKVTATYSGRTVTIPVFVDVVQELSADRKTLMLNQGQTGYIKLTSTDKAGNVRDVTRDAEWLSSSPKYADVSKGAVTAFERGKTIITAKYGGQSVTIAVDVDIITKLTADTRALSLKSGDQKQIAVTATFSNGSERDVTAEADWKTSSYKVADVDHAGQVTAAGYGKAKITASYGGKSISVQVDVDTLKYLKTDVVQLELKKGQTYSAKATATYADGTDEDVSVEALWQSSKLIVADVKDGIIRANGPGKATITVKFAGKRTKIIVTVTD
ncbi:Bacterial Ig-like domain (group 2) [Chlamydia abortus]|uniref:Ig-like domain-containing protein n=1 Tax=unclassified Paenibacillus TaxID=185978 RepID=UPI000A27E28F|nr:Ig-like domain-containing protein [Paenibacillus sp. 32O-W]SHE10582.1 Bacterial Ig-like domain (group 2) [Chlamydia abortus]